ncbi:MAG: C25 family cysteine peptidase [Bacteroidota bacterium]
MKTTLLASLLILTILVSAQEITLNSIKSEFIVQDEINSILISNSIDKIHTIQVKTKNGVFTQLLVDGFTKNNSYGKPNLPVFNKLIEIPHGANIKVNIISYDLEIVDLNNLGLTNKIFPCQPSVNKSIDPDNIEFVYDELFYQVNEYYGGPNGKVDELGIMRGIQIGRISIEQFSYNPVLNILKIYNNIKIEIKFENVDYALNKSIKENKFSPVFDNMLSQKLINYNKSTQKDVITAYPVKYVIVSDPMFQADLELFVKWKTMKGFNVIEAYTDDPNVGTTTTSIKSYLQDLYDAATPSDPAPTYVLFVGDIAQIPVFTGTTEPHVTDLYYCEYTGGGDVFPEVYYGRFSANNSQQLQPQIIKTLEYEQYLFPDPSFLDEVVLVSGVDASFAPIQGNGQINYGTDNYFNISHNITSHTYLYGSGSPITSDQPGAAAAIISNISNGVGFVNYTAHCGPSGWGDPSFTTADIPGLTNAHKYPLSIGNCCSSNEFQELECFGEALLRAEDKGALGHIGGSNSTYWDEDYWWGVGATTVSANPVYDTHLGAYDGAFHDHGETEDKWFISNGQILHNGNLAVAEGGGAYQYYWEIYHLMGDPSIMTYFSVPPAIDATYLNPVQVGTSSLDVITEQYAYVALSLSGVLLDAQYTGSNTTVTLNFPAFISPDVADVVVTKQNREPYIGTLDIVNNNTINDAQLMKILVPQNYHSILNADVNPKVVIRNMGSDSLTSVDVGYNIDGGAITSQAWTGSLVQYDADTIEFTLISLPLGIHTFTAFTSNPNGFLDDFNPGDTLNKQFDVSAGDAKAFAILNLESVYCDVTDYIPVVIIGNTGQCDISQMDVNYKINNGSVVTYNWTGLLNPNQKDTVYFPLISLPVGNNILHAFTSEPNGGTDQNSLNDSISSGFNVFDDAHIIEVVITTDWFGSETTWDLVDDSTSQVLYSGGPFASNSTITESFCVGLGCYTFTIYDEYGDGICCGIYGDGSYTVTNNTLSTVIGTGGDFDFEEESPFCIFPTSITAQEKINSYKMFPNPTSGRIYFQGSLDLYDKIELWDLLGKKLIEVQIIDDNTIFDISCVKNGLYYLKLYSNNQIYTEKIVKIR